MSRKQKKCLTCVMATLWNLCQDLRRNRRYRVSAECVQEAMKPYLGFGADGMPKSHQDCR